MKKQLLTFLTLAFIAISCNTASKETSENTISQSTEENRQAESTAQNVQKDWAIAIHGGAGYQTPDNHDSTRIAIYEAALTQARAIGEDVLKSGGSSLDAVEAVLNFMENSPLFNAGKGAVLTAEGKNEMDASIMNGQDLNCGSVTGVQRTKNPISAARAVMESSVHVFFSGAGADLFAKSQGLEQVDPGYFKTDEVWERYLKIKSEEEQTAFEISQAEKFGTVGCAALDASGNLAAGTSTGGMMMKKNGRIGDSPVIGAGTYADNASCAVSSTGHGEFFIRAAVAHDIAARMLYKKISFQQATEEVVQEKLVEMKGAGGTIGVDKWGNIAMETNTPGMYRAAADSDGLRYVGMFGSGME